MLLVDTQYQLKLDQWEVQVNSRVVTMAYGSDVLTGFDLEVFRDSTLKTTN